MFRRKLKRLLDVLYDLSEKPFPNSFNECKENLPFMYLLATKTMNTQQDIALAYQDKKVVGNITEEGSYVYFLIPHCWRVKLALKWYGVYSRSANSPCLWNRST